MPIRFGIRTAFVFLEIAFVILDISIFKVSISTSTSLGIRPSCRIGDIVVEKVNDGVIISAFFGKSNAASASNIAEEPEFTKRPYYN